MWFSRKEPTQFKPKLCHMHILGSRVYKVFVHLFISLLTKANNKLRYPLTIFQYSDGYLSY